MSIKKITPAATKVSAKNTAVAGKATVKPVASPPGEMLGSVALKQAAKNPKKIRKDKKIRDVFSMPKSEHRKIFEIKEACSKAGLPVKKSAVLRAGLKILCEMNMTQLKQALAGLE